jgi:hypothetical protein
MDLSCRIGALDEAHCVPPPGFSLCRPDPALHLPDLALHRRVPPCTIGFCLASSGSAPCRLVWAHTTVTGCHWMKRKPTTTWESSFEFCEGAQPPMPPHAGVPAARLSGRTLASHATTLISLSHAHSDKGGFTDLRMRSLEALIMSAHGLTAHPGRGELSGTGHFRPAFARRFIFVARG